MFLELFRETFLIVLVVSGIPLLITLSVALLVAVLQSATQIQEQSVQHFVKTLSFTAVLYFGGHYFQFLLTRFFSECLQHVAHFSGNG